MFDMNNIPTPYYVVYEDRLRRNMEILSDVAKRGNVKIIMAFKANALWKTFPIIKEYFTASTASSLNEMKLSLEFLGNEVHTYCPVYTEKTFPEFLVGSTHITFNSLTQFNKFYPQIKAYNNAHPDSPVSAGLRVNPHCSVIETDIYNPCIPGSRFGEKVENLKNGLPEGIEGLHFHALCESSSFDLEKVLDAFEAEYGHLLPNIKWLNMGGGHLMTRRNYDIEHLISLLNKLHLKYPNLQIIMEPGSAFTWQTGDLVTEVLDVVEDASIKTAIIDASFACHMPDCLEMPYKPNILEALPEDSETNNIYRLGGNSCLSGDYTGDWKFETPLKPGDKLTLMDMNHYTTVKTNMFNGIQHPSIWFIPITGEPVLLREYTYEDYKTRMD
ncbi:MAG: carboxynorspermidine decarboxylase [Muribaculaceae bacterium]|nr:carboxynorspermidine decarboxylase [Muribaculaceae bacterium]